jgi:RimJ/RimL family protein N-acetyltransferase
MLALPLRVAGALPGLHLRALRLEDARAFRAIVTRESVGRMLFGFPPDWTLEQAHALMGEDSQPVAPPFRLAIADGTGGLIGSVGFAKDKTDEVAFFLHPDHAGQGVMRAALPVFVGAMFAAFDLPELRAVVYHDNPSSRAVLERTGFVWQGQHEGRCSAWRAGAERLDTFTLIRAAWDARKSSM